jgi:hypothetical protein
MIAGCVAPWRSLRPNGSLASIVAVNAAAATVAAMMRSISPPPRSASVLLRARDLLRARVHPNNVMAKLRRAAAGDGTHEAAAENSEAFSAAFVTSPQPNGGHANWRWRLAAALFSHGNLSAV